MEGIRGKEAEMNFFTLNEGVCVWGGLPTLASCDSNQQTICCHTRDPPAGTHTAPRAGAGVYFCDSLDAGRIGGPPPATTGKSNRTVITQEQPGGRAEHGGSRGKRGPLVPPLCKGQRLVETWGSGCCRSDVQGPVAKWSEGKRGGDGNPSFGGQLPC